MMDAKSNPPVIGHKNLVAGGFRLYFASAGREQAARRSNAGVRLRALSGLPFLRVASALAAACRWPFLLSAACGAAGWMVMPVHLGTLSAGCLHPFGSWSEAFAGNVRFILSADPPVMLAVHWLAMVLMMMPALLWRPLARAAADGVGVLTFGKFFGGYALVWLSAGVAMMPLVVTLGGLGRAMEIPPLVIAVLIAIVWQVTPGRQAALALSHDAGWAGYATDGFCPLFSRGVRTGVGCLGACWAFMLAPLTMSGDGRPLMIAVMALLAIEREAFARLALATAPL